MEVVPLNLVRRFLRLPGFVLPGFLGFVVPGF
jgi:hypothetical protein